MSINWVMLDKSLGFVRLPGERLLFTSPARTTLELSTPNTYPGKEPISIHSSSGKAYLTTQRVVYLPIASTPRFQSFSAPILNLDNTRVTAPFFGANVFAGELRPVAGGNLPAHHALVEIKMTFKDGGAFDFSTNYERLKEQMLHNLSIAQESGSVLPSNGGLPHADLEQLPAYEESGTSPLPPASVASPQENALQAASTVSEPSIATREEPGIKPEPRQESFPPPDEPPPGYEETQATSVNMDLEENIRRMGGNHE